MRAIFCGFIVLISLQSLAQNVGINTPVPKNRLHVTGRTQIDGRVGINTENIGALGEELAYPIFESISENSDSSDFNIVLFEESGFSPWLNFAKARGTKAAPKAIQPSDNIFTIKGHGYNGTIFRPLGGIELYAETVVNANDLPTSMKFFTTLEGEDSQSERMTISKKGFVGIGNSSPNALLSVGGLFTTVINPVAQFTTTGNAPVLFGSLDETKGIMFGMDGNDIQGRINSDFSANGDLLLNKFGGNVGIGTDLPSQARLVVDGNQNFNLGDYGFLKANGTVGTENTGIQNYSIWASNRIAAAQFNAFSDARIKDILGITNNEKDLETLSKIEITNYKFIDKIGKGNSSFKKVIAQQVETVYPQAVSKLTDFIPDIYKLAKIENGVIFLENHSLKAGEKVKLILEEKIEIVEVKSITKNSFSIGKSSIESSPIFVYGRQVTDFRSVDYEAISMLNVSATQALLKKITALESQNNNLKTEMYEVKADIKELKAMLTK
jgi:hypothetical protein